MRQIEPGDLDVRCPTCNAGPGMFCHSTHDRKPFTGMVHRERRDASMDAKRADLIAYLRGGIDAL